MISFKGTGGGHVVAAWVAQDVAFFDSNFGDFWFAKKADSKAESKAENADAKAEPKADAKTESTAKDSKAKDSKKKD